MKLSERVQQQIDEHNASTFAHLPKVLQDEVSKNFFARSAAERGLVALITYLKSVGN